MALSLKHAFTSGKSDGSDASRVQPSNWNAEHTITMATAKILGRTTAGSGAVEELSAADVFNLIGSMLSDGFASTTRLVFQQTAAPTGWTKDTTHNNKAMRLVSGSVSSGGSTAFTSVFGSRTILTANLPAHTHTVSGTSGADGNHTHSYSAGFDEGNAITAGGNSSKGGSASSFTTGSSGTHTHSFSATSSSIGSGTAMDFAVQYVDFTIAEKD